MLFRLLVVFVFIEDYDKEVKDGGMEMMMILIIMMLIIVMLLMLMICHRSWPSVDTVYC